MLSTKEVAALMNVHVQTVRRWIKEGRVHAVKIGHTIRISQEEVNKLKGE